MSEQTAVSSPKAASVGWQIATCAATALALAMAVAGIGLYYRLRTPEPFERFVSLTFGSLVLIAAFSSLTAMFARGRRAAVFLAGATAMATFLVIGVRYPAASDSREFAATDAGAAAPVQSQAAAVASSDEQRWNADVAAFMDSRCDLSPAHGSPQKIVDEVAKNTAIFQRAINEVFQPNMTNAELLAAAGERVYDYPEYTPRGRCPSL